MVAPHPFSMTVTKLNMIVHDVVYPLMTGTMQQLRDVMAVYPIPTRSYKYGCNICTYIYIYIYIYMYMCVHIYIYIICVYIYNSYIINVYT